MTIKGILGQVAPATDTDTDLYTVPDGKSATIKVIVCNKGSDTTFRIAVSKDGAALSGEHYLVSEKSLESSKSLSTASFMAGGNDVIRVRAASADVTFNCTGIEE